MIVTSEYIFNNLKLIEIKNLLRNTLPEHDQRYGYNYIKKVNIKCNAKFFDKKMKRKILLSSVITYLEKQIK